jgi:hypothetical protein
MTNANKFLIDFQIFQAIEYAVPGINTPATKSTAQRGGLFDKERKFMNIFECNSCTPRHRSQWVFAHMNR